jgi:predicted ATPase/class 3 adenylate cyclase/DNA-binding CsgD family transcriptional regulator
MVELPNGTVTFLLTDVQDSTTLWEQSPEAMRRALAQHDELLTGGIERHGGVVIKSRGEGDSLFAVFALASDALVAAANLQSLLHTETWPTSSPIRVRMALDTGEQELRDGDYYGTIVNRCARLRAAAHGGQVLISAATQALVRDHLPPHATLLNLGEHRLRGFEARERIYQLVSPGLPDTFPPLVTVESRPHNLPSQLTALIGRDREVDAVCALLLREDVRLLTMTGPGGSGKTRLSLRVAAEMLDHLPDGVFFVGLAPLHDPELVASAIAHALDERASATQPLLEALQASLRDRHIMLLLDNFEHLPTAVPQVAALLAACPGLKVLATSRAPLRLYGEREFPVLPLALPDLHHFAPLDELAQVPAVALFLDRARAVRPDLTLTTDNAAVVAEVCVRLDGLPLALELAAARIKLLTPRAILARLGSRLDLLSGGELDRPLRHQTLRAALAWSHDALAAEEQRLLRRLAVFIGGWTLDAAQAVAGDGSGAADVEALDGMATLLDHSLIQQVEQPDGEPRFTMLETIRDYARERLEASGESTALRRRHAAYYLALVEVAQPKLSTDEGGPWLIRLEHEMDNLRAVVAWSVSPEGDVETGVRLAEALLWFWMFRGHMREGRDHLAVLLRQVPEPTALRARTLHAAGWLALHHGDLTEALALLDQSLTLRRALKDRRGIATTLEGLGLAAHGLGDPARGAVLLEECLALWQELGGIRLTNLRANLAEVVRDLGDYQRATQLHEDSLAECRERGDRHGVSMSLRGLGHLARLRQQYDGATALLAESVSVVRELGDVRCAPVCLDELACLASVQGWAVRAARLFGAAQAVRTAGGFTMPPSHADYDQGVTEARAALGEEPFMAAWAEGQAMSMEQAIIYALSTEDAAPADKAQAPDRASPRHLSTARTGSVLTPRERETAALVARGLTDPQIAELLVIGRRTAETHVAHCLAKLGLATRTQLAAWVVAHGLVATRPD